MDIPKVRSLLTARDREGLHRQSQQRRGTTEALPPQPRRGVVHPTVMEECRREAQALNLPDLMTLHEAALHVRYRDTRHAATAFFRFLERRGLADRVINRGAKLLVRSEDVCYALRLSQRGVRWQHVERA